MLLATKKFEHFVLDFMIKRCFKFDVLFFIDIFSVTFGKGFVKLIKRVNIAYSFLQSVSDQFYVIILSLSI